MQINYKAQKWIFTILLIIIIGGSIFFIKDIRSVKDLQTEASQEK